LATGLFLAGSVVATLALFRFGGLKGGLAISQDTTISILAPAVVLAASAVTGPAEAKVATGFAVIGVSAVLSGLVFWMIGRLGLGRLVRMFPFSVAAGFLASSGFLLVYAALSLLTHETGFREMLAAAGDPVVELRLIPALVMAGLMVAAMRFFGGTAPVLVIIFVFLIGFYAVCGAIGLTSAEAVALGLLPLAEPMGDGGVGLALAGLVEWGAVWQVAPVIAAVVLLNLLGLLLNVTGVELATRADVDENHELRVAGLANVVVGGFGGLTAYLQGGASIILAKLGVQQGPLVLGYAATMVVAAFLAPVLVAVVPVFIPAALLMFIGLSMLDDWLVATRRRLMPLDWLIVLMIVLATALVGILPAMGIGLGLALVGFAYASIRLPIIRHSTTVQRRRSIRDRPVLHGEALQREGGRIHILHLQGPLFFGSVEQLIRHLRGIMARQGDVHAVIIDFREVLSFDSAACAALDKLAHLMRSQGVAAHLTGVSAELRALFGRWGLGDEAGVFRIWNDLDGAIAHCETGLLAGMGMVAEEIDIARMLFDLGRQHGRVPDLIGLMHEKRLEKGDYLIRAAEASGDVFIIMAGRLGVHLPTDAGGMVRIRVMGPGTIVGEIAYMTGQPRNADVICEEASQVLCLPAGVIRRIEAEDRDLAALMMSIFARGLAVKLAQSNTLLTYGFATADTGRG
ncbi:MAG: cyclic nucleotide-binding domain-containing protein, partial [Paracoccaceae bacterium]